MHYIDLNSDIGESFGHWPLGHDAQMLEYVSSANIACGFHAGDPLTIKKTVDQAQKLNVAIGAHPSYPDLVGFGRREMNCTPDQIYSDVLYQIGAIKTFCQAAGTCLQHVKPHGAMYNMAAKDLNLALAIAQATKDAGKDLILLGLANSQLHIAAQKIGIPYASEAFADRAYMPDGSLAPRNIPGALINSPQEAAKRVITIIKERKVTTIDGTTIPLTPDSICLHSDTPNALQIASCIKTKLKEADITIRPLRPQNTQKDAYKK